MKSLEIKQITPIQIVDAIEPALEFWKNLGFEKIVDVPHEGRVGFVLLARGQSNIMLQSRASAAADVPAMGTAGSALYIYVASIEAAIEHTAGLEVVVPRRKTNYGADEIWVRDPSGVLIGFAHNSRS